MNWTGKRVLVTGAGGFIGSHLTESLLARGARVRGMVRYNSRSLEGHLDEIPNPLRRNLEVFPGDVTDPFCVREAVRGRDTVFHLAALIAIPYSYQAPASYVQTNVTGTLNILDACLRGKVKRVVHTSTSEVYGTARYVPIDEEHPLHGQSPYSASKIGADQLAESFYRSFGLPVSIVRPFNTYGPRQSARAVIPTIVTQLLAGKKEIRLGSLNPVRDFNFVSDTVEGFIAAAASPKSVGEVINIGSGRGISIRDTVSEAFRATGARAKIVADSKRIRPEKSEVFRLIAGNAKARKLLAWRPRRDIRYGMLRVVEYLQRNASAYKENRYTV